MALPSGYIVYKYPTLASTNLTAKALLNDLVVKNNFVVQAIQQTSGRGRGENIWASPPGNLYASLVLEEKFSLPQLTELVLLVAVSLGEAIGLKEIYYKWPNDLIVNDQKLGGVLIEVIKNTYIIIGVGINVKVAPIKETAFLNQFLSIDADELLERWLTTIETYRVKWQLEGLEAIKKQWLSRCYSLYKKVQFIFNGKEVRGIFQGLNAKCQAIIKTDTDEIFYFGAGELF